MNLPTITAESLAFRLVEAENLPDPGAGGEAFQKAIAANNAATQSRILSDRQHHSNEKRQQYETALTLGLDSLREGYAQANLGEDAVLRGDIQGGVTWFQLVLGHKEVLFDAAHTAIQYLTIIYRTSARPSETALLGRIYVKTHERLGHRLAPEIVSKAEAAVRDALGQPVGLTDQPLEFYCPHCNQHIVAEIGWAGLQTNCPTCSGVFVVPTAETPGQTHPRDIPAQAAETVYSHAAIIDQLRRIANASMNPQGAPADLKTYDQRLDAAVTLGEQLHQMGGMAAMRKALHEHLGNMPGTRTIDQFWDGIGDWRG